MSRNYTELNKEKSSDENLSTNEIKTTDINILLNRVRSDKKKIFKKNILVSLSLVSLVSLITIFIII
tara:strand:+ start:237 stop:437 length:201 start_codon:yes stop_codon:yes gene_type:complete